jgi:dTDP-4-dehydrorhamnose 3,5-epimerase
MKIISEDILGVKLIQPQIFEDERGYFYESFNTQKLNDLGIHENFVQDNQSLSNKGVLRGLHFQIPPMAQGKLVRVVKGSVYDVAVDIRKDSPTYGQHFGVELNESNKLMLWVPAGFAHGFCTLEDQTIFSYKCTNYYDPKSESGISWNDPDLEINWGLQNPTLSLKDQNNVAFKAFNSPF